MDGGDLEVGGVPSRGTDKVGGLPMIQKDRIRLVGEQVDRWSGVKGETFLPHPRG